MRTNLYRLPSEETLTDAKLNEFIMRHSGECAFRYSMLQEAYETDYPILHEPLKPKWKPDNRIMVNFAKYIVDTMNGFFIGHPIKLQVDDGNEAVEKYVDFLDQYNDQDDNNAELSKICSIFGKGYEMYYVDENGNIGITYLSPLDAFMIYDDSVLERERYFVRLYYDSNQILHGSVSDETKVRWFTIKGKLLWDADENYTKGSGPYTVTWTSTKLASLPSGSINANPLQAAKTATNFMQFTDGTGLEVGNKTSGSWSGYRTKISASAFEILNRAGTTLAYYGDKLIQLGKNAKDAVIELCGGVGKILVETKSGNAALSIQSEYVDIKGVHESVLETSSSSGSCIAGAVDDSFVVNTYSDANNKANFDIGNGSIILESKKKGYQAEVEFYGCGWSGGVYTGAFAPTKAYSEKIMLGDSGRVWERLIVKNSPQVTSDRRAKTNIFPLGESKINKTDIHSELFDRLKPVQYRMIDGDGRICYGFVAQDVVEAMRELGIREDELDLVHHDRKNTEDGYIDTYSMVYTNLIAIITHELQLEKQRRSNLEVEVADLRSELESMRDNISGDTN